MKFSKAEVEAIIEASPRTFVPFNKLVLSEDHQARSGGTVPALLNAANEVAVAAFLERKIAFLDIPRLIEAVMGAVPRREVGALQDVLEADVAARHAAQEWIAR